MGSLPILPAVFALLGFQLSEPLGCASFDAPLVAIDSGAPGFIYLHPIGTCLRDAQLYFAYGVENTSDAYATVRVSIGHFTRSGVPMGRGMVSATVRRRGIDYTMSRWWQEAPFPLRGSDVFVAAIVGVEDQKLNWRADPNEVATQSRRVARGR